jgi:hypothetical protein
LRTVKNGKIVPLTTKFVTAGSFFKAQG